MHIVLETDRLILRRFTAADADNLVALDSDPEVMRYINGGRATLREEIVTSVLPRFMSYDDIGYGFFAVVEKAIRAVRRRNPGPATT